MMSSVPHNESVKNYLIDFCIARKNFFHLRDNKKNQRIQDFCVARYSLINITKERFFKLEKIIIVSKKINIYFL